MERKSDQVWDGDLVMAYTLGTVEKSHLRPIPTKWETSREISSESYEQIHDIRTLSLKMIYNMPGLLPYLGFKTYYFLEKFFCFLLNFEMFNKPYLH